MVDGATEAGAKLVFADNLYAYGPPDEPMTEETPQRAPGKKGRIGIQMADAVLGAHADGPHPRRPPPRSRWVLIAETRTTAR